MKSDNVGIIRCNRHMSPNIVHKQLCSLKAHNNQSTLIALHLNVTAVFVEEKVEVNELNIVSFVE